MAEPTHSHTESWRHSHMGHWLRLALQRFDARVLALMTHHADMPLGLANLVARGQVGAAHIHITRHLATDGSRLTDLAQRAGMSKQAMAALVAQCEAWGMVERAADPADARAQRRDELSINRATFLHAEEIDAQGALQEVFVPLDDVRLSAQVRDAGVCRGEEMIVNHPRPVRRVEKLRAEIVRSRERHVAVGAILLRHLRVVKASRAMA